MSNLIINLILLTGFFYLLFRRFNVLESVALAILLLLGEIGVVGFVLNEYFGLSYSQAPMYLLAVNLLLLFSSVLCYFFSDRKFENKKTFAWIFVFPLLLILFRSFFMPVRGWDAYSMYDGRAKMLMDGYRFKDLKVFSEYDDTNYMYYVSYPPMTSVIHAVVYSLGLKSPMFVYALFFMSCGILFYSVTRSRKINKYIKAGIVIVGIFNPLFLDQVNVAYTNLVSISFQIGSIFLIYEFIKEKKFSYILFSSVLLAFSNWTRSLEPIYIAILFGNAFVIFTSKETSLIKKVFYMITFSLVAISPNLFWRNYLSANLGDIGGTSQMSFGEVLRSIPDSLYLTNILEVVFFVYKSFLSIKFYFLLLIIDIIYLFKLRNFWQYKKEVYLLILIISVILIMTAGTFYFSVAYPWWSEISGSFLRSNLILLPLIAMLTLGVINIYAEKK